MRSAAAAGGPLVIGIGNPLRGDDGVGWWLAERARRWPRGQQPAPRVRLVQQLTPELSLEVAEAERVLFVDAWCAPASDGTGGPRLQVVSPRPGESAGHQGLEPADVMALAGRLWPRAGAGPAWELLIPAHRFGHGARLSPEVRRWLPRGLELLNSWCDGTESEQQGGSG